MKQLMRNALALALWVPVFSVAGVVIEIEANNSLATAQAVDFHFTLGFSPDIGNGTHTDNTSTTIPHVTVVGSGDGSFDYYSFYFPGPGTTSGFVVLDVDHTSSSLDSHVALWSADGSLLGHNDDYDYRGGAEGSRLDYGGTTSYDSLMTTYLTAPGTYIVGVGRWAASPGTGGYSGGFINAELQPGDVYTLQISVEGVPAVPEPASWAMTVAGLIGLIARTLRQRRSWAIGLAHFSQRSPASVR